LPTRQLVSTGTWNLSFWKDELGWARADRTDRQGLELPTPAQRAAGAIVAVNYGTAGALALYGPASGLPAPVSATFRISTASRADARAATHCSSASTARSARALRQSTVLAVIAKSAGTSTTMRAAGPIIWCRCAPLSARCARSFAMLAVGLGPSFGELLLELPPAP